MIPDISIVIPIHYRPAVITITFKVFHKRNRLYGIAVSREAHQDHGLLEIVGRNGQRTIESPFHRRGEPNIEGVLDNNIHMEWQHQRAGKIDTIQRDFKL